MTYGQLFVNEVMVQNTNTISDNFGEFDDWIEIHNTSNIPIDLSGYFITDNNDLNKFEIKSGNAAETTVPANGFLLLWADEDSNQGENHLNFKLSDGESVTLVNQDGVSIIHSLTIPSLKDDESFGLISDGSSNARVFGVSTPLSPNPSSLDANILFSVTSRSFVNNFNLTLSTTASGGVLRYTTNGTDPTSSSAVYSGPLSISNTTTVKAAFFFNNGNVSLIRTERYVKMSSSMGSASSDLPIIMIHTYNQTLDATNLKTTFWSVIEPTNGGRAYGSDIPAFSGRTNMKIRGASSSSFPKKQWRCEIQNEDGSDRDETLLGMPAESDWVLYAPGRFDRGLINNALMYEMSNRLGKYAPRCRFVEVYYNEGNEIGTEDYWGIYILMENIKIGNNRVDINKLDPIDNAGDDLTGGYMASLNWVSDFTTPYTESYYGNATRGYELEGPSASNISATQLNYFKSELVDFENALTSANWLDSSTGYKTKTNIETWTAPHILKALAKEPDGFHLSFYLQKDKNDLIETGPLWDFDRAINSTDTRSADYFGWDTSVPGSSAQGNVYYWKGGVNAGAYINQMVNDPDYETLIYDHWFDWRRNSVLDLSNVHALIDSMANDLTESYVREFNRWGSVNSQYTPRYGGFDGEINAMKTWFQNRMNWIDGEFLSPPNFSPGSSTAALNSTVALSNTAGAGTIYYTLDGSDPRLPGGAISSTAIGYSGPVSITKKGLTYITARTRLNSGDWSAICTQQYFVAEDYSGLVINEIHYNPYDEVTPTNDTIGGKNFEFIEIKNCGDNAVNLNGIDFIQGGVDLKIQNCLTIQPDGFVVLADDAFWFEYKYGFAPDAIYEEKLDNGGELLHLVDPNKMFIDSVRYNDALPWPGTADKGFYSLALKECTLDNTIATNWAIQSIFTTPRAENYFTDFGEHGFSGIVINEIHYNPMDDQDAFGNIIAGTNYEFIELKNISTAPIDLTDVFFSRGIDYFFPDNTIIQPGAFIVLAENSTRFQERYGFAPFDSYGGKLSDGGESVWMERITPTGPVLLDAVNYDDAFPWDTQADGGSTDFSLALIDGIVDNNTRLNWKVQCNTLYTPAAENVFPCFNGLNYTGLVINEFTYSPALGNQYEFIEIMNSSSFIMNLEELRFSSAMTYKFGNVFLLPGQYITVARDSALFKTTYGITPIGEYIGGLSSNGETIILEDLFGETIDSVTYGVASPWNPEPLQGIKSLALIDPSLDNTLPESWCTQATDITPGAINSFADGDNDAIIDCLDQCPNFNNNVIGTACNDGDPCTSGETYSSNCGCDGGVFQDADGDGICDAYDMCPGFNDTIDTDNNGIPDGCEACDDIISESSNSFIVNDTSAITTILTNGRVPAGNDIDYHAGESIVLLGGFEVEMSAVFHAYIEPCN